MDHRYALGYLHEAARHMHMSETEDAVEAIRAELDRLRARNAELEAIEARAQAEVQARSSGWTTARYILEGET